MHRSRIVKRGLITICVVLAILAVLLYRGDLKGYSNCTRISEWFNAKPVTYQGKTYQVKVCGDGEGVNGAPESIKLSVYAPDGDLLAVRRFTANFLGTIHPLEYKPEGVEYWDDYYGPVIIRMPPTWIDRVWARIPISDGIPPFYIDKEAIEQEVARATAPRSVAPVLDPDEPVIPSRKAEVGRSGQNRP